MRLNPRHAISPRSDDSKIALLLHWKQKKAMLDLLSALQTPSERKVLLYLRNIRQAIDVSVIAKKCHLPPDRVNSVIGILLKKGLVRCIDQKLFVSP